MPGNAPVRTVLEPPDGRLRAAGEPLPGRLNTYVRPPMNNCQVSTGLPLAAAALIVCLALATLVSGAPRRSKKEPDVEPLIPSDDWRRLGEPKPGDWLYVFDEPGQTFAEYKRELKNRKSDRRDKIYVVPIGELDRKHPDLLKSSVRYFSIFFDCEVVQLDPRPLPRSTYNAKRGQYDAGAALDKLLLPLVRERKDALAMIGLTSEDLYHGTLNFVFGVGSHRDRVGLQSVYRFYRWIPKGKDRDRVALVRTLKTGSHEIGHILGMSHCTFYECVMNGSNSLDESDRRPLFLCPVCMSKLEWNTGLDRLARYRKLRDFFKQCKLKGDEAFCKRRAEELEKLKASSTE